MRPYEQRKSLHRPVGGRRPPLRKDTSFSMCGSSGGIPNQKAAEGRPQTMTQRCGHGLERRSKEMKRRIPVRVFGAEWTLRRRGPRPPFWSFQGDGFPKGRGNFEIPLPLGDFLVPFASLQKELAAAAAKPLFCFRGCSACGRATFQRRKVAKVLRACGPGPRGVLLIPY